MRPWNGAKYRETDKTTISKNDSHYILEWFFGKFFHYLLPPSGVISSFLFLRNIFQFLGVGIPSVMFEGPPTIEKWEKKNKWTKCFERKFGGCIFSVWDVYWCSQNQTWTSRAGSRTPSLDSKMCQFPGISLSELWKVRSFRLIPVNNRPKNEAFELDAGFRLWWQFPSKTSLASFVQAKSDSLSQNLLLENDRARKCEWNSTKRTCWTHSKCCPEMVPNTGKRTKPQFLKMTCVTYLNDFSGNSFITFCRLLK